MKLPSWNSPAAVVVLVLALALAHPGPCSAMLSFGYVSKEQAEQQGVEIRWQPSGPKGVWVELAFKTEGDWKAFAVEQRSNYVDLRVAGAESSAPIVRAALREDRSTPGRIKVSFTAERAKLHQMELWIIRYGPDVADVVRLSDFIPLDKIDRPAEADQERGEQAEPGEEPSPPASSAPAADQR